MRKCEGSENGINVGYSDSVSERGDCANRPSPWVTTKNDSSVGKESVKTHISKEAKLKKYQHK